MWALGTWLLLGALSSVSAQLIFKGNETPQRSICNETVILPCTVINLQSKNIKEMFVKWKLEKKVFFVFDGSTEKTTHPDNSFSTAALASVQNLIQGDASLSISKQQAVPGNYSCEVTESNREGESVITLSTYRPETWFTRTESTFIIVVLVVAILLYWSQLCVILLKCDITSLKKSCLIVGGFVILIFTIIGSILLVSDGYTPKNQAGLGLIVIPAVILVPLQYFVLQIVLQDKQPCAIAVVVLKSIGYLVAVIGFGLCVGACPPKSGVVVIVGLAIMAFIEAVGLIYLIINSSSKKSQQLSGKAVEEPLNDAKGVMLE